MKKRYLTAINKESAHLLTRIGEIETSLRSLNPTKVPIFRERAKDKYRPDYIHDRGFFLNKGKKVTRGTPAFLPKMDKSLPNNRLGVAKWLMDKDNPLTARVAVNRIWSRLFGKGIVETEEDFGNQGMLPTNPELLDWLAVNYRENGWSRKKLIKTIVMSATYKQTSDSNAILNKKDPSNQYFARGPRVRMTAEMIRDSALKAAGLLSDKMYGQPIMPYQPPGIWKSTYNYRKWVVSKGQDKYRRAIYIYRKRTSTYPSLTTFDATSREVCTVRRIKSNTPLQALVTLNDKVYVEAAQAFARRIIKTGGSDKEKISYLFKTSLSRKPLDAEVAIIEKLLKNRRAFYKSNPKDALSFSTKPLGDLPADIKAAEAAAWTAVCNTIMNLDEFLTKR